MDSKGVVYDDQQGHRSPGGEAATLLARVEALEVFLSLKFPGWREEMAALIKEGQTAEKKAAAWVLSGNSKNATLSNGGLTLTKTSGGRSGWDCNVLGNVGWQSGVHEFSVRMESSCEIMIGVAPGHTNPAGPNWSSCGFYLGTHSGALFGQDGTWKRDYLRQRCSKKGTTVRVRLDCDKRSLWFATDNDEFPQEAAFENLPHVPLYPSFDVDSKGSSFTVEARTHTPTLSKK